MRMILILSLLLPLGSQASVLSEACGTEMKKYCNDTSDEVIQATNYRCLDFHYSNLATPCQALLQRELYTKYHCFEDALRYCKGQMLNFPARNSCLDKTPEKLISSKCLKYIAEFPEKLKTEEKLCGADYRKYCPDYKGGRGFLCADLILMQKQASASCLKGLALLYPDLYSTLSLAIQETIPPAIRYCGRAIDTHCREIPLDKIVSSKYQCLVSQYEMLNFLCRAFLKKNGIEKP